MPTLRIDILNSIDGVKFEDAIKNVQTIEENDLNIPYIGVNDLLANKISTGRKRDIDDIKEIKKILHQQKHKP